MNSLIYEGVSHIFSRKLAEMAGCTPEQVRRDLMAIGYQGSTVSGYDVSELEYSIGYVMDDPEGVKIAIVGGGLLGRAILDYCYWRYPNFSTFLSFSNEKDISDKVYHGCKCYTMKQIEEVLEMETVDIVILAIESEHVQNLANRLVKSGVIGILNYTPIHLDLPSEVFVEDMDLMLAIDKAAFFVKHETHIKKKKKKKK